jgi:hypothetical protein
MGYGGGWWNSGYYGFAEKKIQSEVKIGRSHFLWAAF